MQGVCHSPNTLPTIIMVCSQFARIITRWPQMTQRTSHICHPHVHWTVLWVEHLHFVSRSDGDCYLTPSENFYSHIMVSTIYLSMRWCWCLLCTRL